MKRTLRVFLASTALASLSAGSGAALADSGCTLDKLYYRTTHWLSLQSFVPSRGGAVSPVYDGTDDFPAALLLNGGSLGGTLEVPIGFRIKKILVCGSQTPAPVFAVELLQPQNPNLPSLAFQFHHPLIQRPACGVYLASGSDGWGPGLSVDPRLSPTVLRIGPPPNQSGEITAVGLRLQADPESPVFGFVPYHRHEYLTGRGRGHNNTSAWTLAQSEACEAPPEDSDELSDSYYVPAPPAPVTGSAGGFPGNGGADDHADDHGHHGKSKGKGKGKSKD